jgi:hypothetical protein
VIAYALESHHRPASPEGARNGRTPPTPTAWRKPGTSWLDFYDEVDQLVAHFEQPVVERQKAAHAEKGQTWRGKDLDKRRESWQKAAIRLLEYHPLDEVIETIDYVFGPWNGYLPSSVTASDGRSLKVDKNGRSLKHDDLKVTRLQLIHQGYDSIREHMANPDMAAEPEPLEDPRPLGPKPRQAQVDELMADFTEFRASVGDRNVDKFRINNWIKTFEIRLRQYSFEDVKAVIAAIRGLPQYVDQRRYRNPYRLFENEREWRVLQGHVQTYERKQSIEKAAQPAVVKSAPKPTRAAGSTRMVTGGQIHDRVHDEGPPISARPRPSRRAGPDTAKASSSAWRRPRPPAAWVTPKWLLSATSSVTCKRWDRDTTPLASRPGAMSGSNGVRDTPSGATM